MSKVIVYSNLLPKLKSVGESELKVYLCICLMGKGHIIVIDKEFILGIMDMLGYTEGTVRNCVSSLSKNGLLLKLNKRGLYSPNPDFAWNKKESLIGVFKMFHEAGLIPS